MKSLHLLTITCLVLAAFEISITEGQSPAYCYDFNEDRDYWEGFGEWVWTGTYSPPFYPVPPGGEGNYLYVDYSAPVGSPYTLKGQVITLDVGDVVQAQFYTTYTGLYPSSLVLNFIDVDTNPPTTYTVLTAPEPTGGWHESNTGCSPSGHTVCCTIYPCTGYFEVTGQKYTSGDMLAVDGIAVNDDICR